MSTSDSLRHELVFHLTTGHAHMPFADAVANFPEQKMNTLFTNGDYTFWHLLEHIRRTQKDILDFMTDLHYKEPEWPKDYWPKKVEKATQKEWDKTVNGFQQDQEELVELVKDPKTDLFKKLPQGTGQTVAREILVVVDHNAYHIGEFAIMRQVLNAWGKH
jgi:DinB superfamily